MSVAQNRHAIERALKRIQFHDADFVLIDQPLMSAATKLQLPGRIVYRPTDIYPSGVPARRQRQLLRHAHAVIATSAYVLDKLGVEAALPTVVIGNGVEFSRFVARQTGPARSGLVYVGAIDYRFDWKFILSASRAFPHEAFTLYGPVTTNIPRLPANVRLAGPTPYQSIPEILVTARVGLLPLSPVETNLGRSPMKLYEYIAAGLPVVTRRRGPGWDSELDRLVFTYNDADDAIGAVEKALSAVPEPDLTKRVASSQDWSHKAAEVEAFLDIVARE
jgi:glycosyltransferase involved in cell wall biosynthesis